MFIDFFYLLRSNGIPVSSTEWLTLMSALQYGLAGNSLFGFYALCRGICVKTESHYDQYDQCFATYFHDISPPEGLADKLMEWLKDKPIPEKVSQNTSKLKDWDFEQMRREFEKRLREQKEKHSGGNHWIGTGGFSPFGHSGAAGHPDGIRVSGQSMHQSAAQIASQRQFKNLRNDRILDTRTMGMALKRLRALGRQGQESEIDLDQTIKKTASNAGELDLAFRAPRKNTLKIVLFMDIGGSMTPYSQLCEQLFSAAHAANHFKAFKHFYFHNCPYDYLFTNIQDGSYAMTMDVLAELDPSWILITVGDAAMNPNELLSKGGAIDYFYYNKDPGIVWLQRIRERLPKSIWLNPKPKSQWDIASNRLVRDVFHDMYPLTIDGLTEAIQVLNRSKGSRT